MSDHSVSKYAQKLAHDFSTGASGPLNRRILACQLRNESLTIVGKQHMEMLGVRQMILAGNEHYDKWCMNAEQWLLGHTNRTQDWKLTECSICTESLVPFGSKVTNPVCMHLAMPV